MPKTLVSRKREFQNRIIKPTDPINPTPGKWLVPKPESLLLMLRQAGGDIALLLDNLGHEDDHQDFMFVILELLDKKGSEFYKTEWNKLKLLHENAKLEILKARYLKDVVEELEPAKRKTDFGRRTKSWGDVTRLFPQRKAVVQEEKSSPFKDELMASLSAIREAMQ